MSGAAVPGLRAEPLRLPGVLRLVRTQHADARGWLMEAWNARDAVAVGLPGSLAQENLVESGPGVLRGLHLQHPGAQGKLVEVLAGAIHDVAVDVRVGSPTFGQHVAVRLDAEARHLLWVPPGFAHGFAVLGSTPALVLYRMTVAREPEHEVSIAYDDPRLGIAWPVARPILSARDAQAPRLEALDPARLPRHA